MDRIKMVKMREQATSVFELTKGFSHPPKDEAMKTALEMAGYVLELTSEVEGVSMKNPFACFGNQRPHIMDFDDPEEYRTRLANYKNWEENHRPEKNIR